MAELLAQIKAGVDRYQRDDQFRAAIALETRRLLAEMFMSAGWHETLQAMTFACPTALTATAREILHVSTGD
jgi:hypothetical protein